MGSWNSPRNAACTELKILLVGPRRTGKSSVGNTLLGGGQIFDTSGGEASTASSATVAGRQVTVVDAQGWGGSEDSVPREEKSELLRALALCGSGGPHVILLVIPLLDFTEPERRAVEKRMEVLTSGVWRHTMVLFTCGDLLKGSGRSVQQHIQSAGQALHWLMEKCRYRYHVMDNKASVTAEQEKPQEEAARRESTWRRSTARKTVRNDMRGGKKGAQEPVRELLNKVEDMLQENGGWHFSLHMYQRLEEEWSRREQQLRVRLETDVGSVRTKEETAETKVKVEAEPRVETGEGEDGSPEKEQENKQSESLEKKPKTEGNEEKLITVELRGQSSEDRDGEEEDGWDTGSDSGVEREDEESNEAKTGMERNKCKLAGFKSEIQSHLWPDTTAVTVTPAM